MAVYCGAASGADPVYADAATGTADELVANGIELVYGGSRLGLMGLIADRVMAGGGHVHGVIPRALVEVEAAHLGLTELHTVDTMHERKAAMTDLADAFLVLPGGIGTLDELFEAWTWRALGYHAKPVCLLNVANFWDGLTAFLDHVSASAFISPARRSQLLVANEPDRALHLLDRAAGATPGGIVW